MKYADLVKESSTTVGTGPFTTTGAATGSQTFAQGFALNDVFPYRAFDSAGNWEIGIGTLTAATTIARTTVTRSSNNNALVNFPAGAKTIVCTLTAAQISAFASALSDTTNAISNVSTSKIVIEEGGVIKRISMADFLAALGTTAGGLQQSGALAGGNIVAVSQDGGATFVRTTLSALATFVKSQP